MCTAICSTMGDFYFGRNMDIEQDFGGRIVLTPRLFWNNFRATSSIPQKYAILGTAAVIDGYPLYADAFNEKGLCMAGLHFPDNTYYYPKPQEKMLNFCPFELIPYILGHCENISQARAILQNATLIDVPFRADVALTPLHWIIADRSSTLVVEASDTGLKLYDNDLGVLTNNPPFPFHVENLKNYINVSPTYRGAGTFCELTPSSYGVAAHGLPGDYSSPSRFIKAAYLRRVSQPPHDADEQSKTAHFFSLLAAVAPPRGAVLDKNGQSHYTFYSCCINADKGTYYFKSYNKTNVLSVSFSQHELCAKELILKNAP